MPVFLIAIRNMVGEKGRLAITVGGVAFAVLLILVLIGLYTAWSVQITRFLGSLPADIWIGQKGSRDMSHSVSLLSRDLQAQIEEIEGVTNVTPFVGRQVSFELNGAESRLFLVAVDKNFLIKPYKVIEGKTLPDSGEIIVDQIYAREENLSIGDTLNISGKKLNIVGISTGGNLLVYSYAFAQETDVREILKFDVFSNYYLVQGENPKALQSILQEKFPEVAVFNRETFLENNTEIVTDTFLPIIGVLVLIAIAIGTAVIGLTIFTATIEKSNEYGVLKAIGYTNQELFAIVFIQSLVAGFLGFIVGNLLVFIIVPIAETKVSAFIYRSGIKEISLVLAITIFISIVASLIPLRRIMSIDPVKIFKV